MVADAFNGHLAAPGANMRKRPQRFLVFPQGAVA